MVSRAMRMLSQLAILSAASIARAKCHFPKYPLILVHPPLLCETPTLIFHLAYR